MDDASIELNGPVMLPASGEEPKQIVVMLHGLGSNGDDLISLVPALRDALPEAVFVSPHAPFACDMAPFGFQWFSLQSWSEAAMLDGVCRAAPILNRYIDAQLEAYGLEDKDLILLGFSQGCMMALHTALRRPKPCAAVLGYSGAFVGSVEVHRADLTSKPPVSLIHGALDAVVPLFAYQDAKTKLEALGVPVEGHVSPHLMHAIDEMGIRVARDVFLSISQGLSATSSTASA